MLASALKGIAKPAYKLSRSFASTMDYKLYWWSKNSLVGGHAPDTPELLFQSNYKIVSLSCGRNHYAMVLEDGSLWTWGSQSSYALGHDSKEKVETPKRVEALDGIPVEQVSCGDTFTVAVTPDGEVLSWGHPGSIFSGTNALGYKTKHIIAHPALVESLCDQKVKIHKIGAGANFVTALSENGDIYSWGDGYYGKLANGGNSKSILPQKSDYLSEEAGPFVDISVGSNFALGLTAKNHLYSWGHDDGGQLGIQNQFTSEIKLGDTYPNCIYEKETPIKVIAAGHGCGSFVDNQGKLTWWGSSSQWSQYEEPVFANGGVLDVQGGDNFFAAIHENGLLYLWGKSSDFPSGIEGKKRHNSPTVNPTIEKTGRCTKVACGKDTVLAVVEN